MKYKTIKLLILATAVTLGANYVSAQTWNPAPSSPPSNNVGIPINVTTVNQVKTVGTTTGNYGGLSVGTFLANLNAQFVQDLTLSGVVSGGNPGDATSTINFGDAAAAKTVNLVGTGGLNAKTFLQSGALANAMNSKVCADSSGKLILCGASVPALKVTNACTGSSGATINLHAATSGFVMYELHNVSPTDYDIQWGYSRFALPAWGTGLEHASLCGKATNYVACVYYFNEGTRPGKTPPPGYDFRSNDVEVTLTNKATGAQTVIAPANVQNIDNATYCTSGNTRV